MSSPGEKLRDLGIASKQVLFVIYFIAAVFVLTVLVEYSSYLMLENSDYSDTWLYLTAKNERTDFDLRPGIHSRWTGVDIFVNRSGIRDVSRDLRTEREENESIIFVVGDSNTFGNGMKYERTYAHQIQLQLPRLRGRRVKVIIPIAFACSRIWFIKS